MANKVTYGLKNVHVAFRSADDSSGEPVWATPIAIPGAVSFKPAAEGEEVKFYADNGVYFTATTNNGYSADLEMALVPDSTLATMLNWDTDANGAIVEDADALPAPFALGFEIDGDDKNRKTWFYECRAARPEREEKTKQSTIEVGTDMLKLTITAVAIGGVNVVRAVMEEADANSSSFDVFFDEVYVPVEAA